MLLLKDGVRYLPYDYASEEELTEMVIEHYREIFGVNTLFFDPQTMKTSAGTGARSDGLVIDLGENKWYILEVELAEHQLHEHIIPQITKFSVAYEETETRKKIITALHTAIRQTQKIEDLHKILTDLIDIEPTIAIIIDQETPELDLICKKLPFPTQTIQFKTYTRENIGIGVHIHEFQPLFEKKIEIEPRKRPTVPSGEGPRKLVEVIEVAELVFRGEPLSKAFKNIAKHHGINESTVRDKCTRQLGVNTEQFRDKIQDKNRFITFLKEKYPQYENLIDERLP